MLEKIDFWLLRKLEKFAHWWQKLTGKNCFWLAKVSIICYGMLGLLACGIVIITKRIDFIFIGSFMMLVIFAIVFLNIKDIERREEFISKLNILGLSNPFKISEMRFRIVNLCFVPIFTLVSLSDDNLPLILNTISSITFITLLNIVMWFTLVWYFSACDPLPPETSKMKKWKTRFINAVNEIFSPAPQPTEAP